MIKRIIREFKENKNHKEHMDYVPPDTDNPELNFNELIQLSKRANSRFRIKGNNDKFIVLIESSTVIFVCLSLILLSFPFFIADSYSSNYFLPLEAIMLLISFIFFRYGPIGYDFEFNSITKQITVMRKGLIGKYLKPKLVIDYNDFVRISGMQFKEVYNTKGFKQTECGVTVYIQYKNTSFDIVKLPNGPFYYINHKVFIQCLNKIIEFYKK